MKKHVVSLVCLSLIALLKTSAQVTIGDFDHLIIGQQAIGLNPSTPPSGTYVNAYDSLDFNGDGQYDVLFHLSVANTTNNKGGLSEITALHPGFEFVGDVMGNVARLTVGNTVGASNTWLQGTGKLVSKFYDMGVLNQSGNWVNNASGFAGFRIVTAQDTFYGWMPVSTGANANSPSAFANINSNWVVESAIPVQYNHFVIAGNTSGLIPGNQTLALYQGPVVFGDDSEKGDSLDLNMDGTGDVYFSAGICNSFDCSIGATGVRGKHPGLNFIDGAASIRRFNAGDTIASVANWDLYGPNHYGTFVSIGAGLGGFQSLGEWVINPTGYFGFRLVTPDSDTLLGWVHVYTYSQSVDGVFLQVDAWAIEPDTAGQKPAVELAFNPQKAVYCAGDTVLFQAETQDAEQIVWHFWDGTTDSSAMVLKVLPDSTVSASFEAGNTYGTTIQTEILEVSPLTLTVPDIILDCTNPTAMLSAETNIPAEIWWVIGNDTFPGPIPPVVNIPGPILVIARDDYGCVVIEQVDFQQNVNIPDVDIIYDESNHVLFAHSNTSGVVFQWNSNVLPAPVFADSLLVTESGIYTLEATGPNGCSSVASIAVVITATSDLRTESVRVQPNPAGDFLKIENKGDVGLKFKAYDPTGKLRLTTNVIPANGVSQQDLSTLPAGLYWLVGCDVEGRSLFFRKLIKL